MRPEAVRILLASLGFALSLGVVGRGVSVPPAEAAVFAHATAIETRGVVADEEGGSDDSGSGEDDQGEDDSD
jgi:hypothetical protein